MPEKQISQKKAQPQDKILCMLSGGLDSLAVLYHLLTKDEYKKYKIHVHHMILKNIERRAPVEKAACDRILNYLKSNNYREFEYTESLHDTSFLKRYFIYDSAFYGFMGANMMINDTSIKSMAIGSIADERDKQGATLRANKGKNVYYSILPEEYKFQRPYIYPVAHMTKLEIYRSLPEDLRKLAWSCRRPIYREKIAYACKKCKACLQMDEIRRAEAESKNQVGL